MMLSLCSQSELDAMIVLAFWTSTLELHTAIMSKE